MKSIKYILKKVYYCKILRKHPYIISKGNFGICTTCGEIGKL